MDEFIEFDAVGQAELMRQRQVSPLELVDAAIARIESSGELNAVVMPTFELARTAAQGSLPDGPLSGVPFLVKDFGTEWAGVRFTEGSNCSGEYVSPIDQELAARFRRARLILLTSCPVRRFVRPDRPFRIPVYHRTRATKRPASLPPG